MRTFLLLIALLPTLAVANECKFTAQRDFDVDAVDLKTVAFALGSSDIVVQGVPDLVKIEVRGKACASDESWLDALRVDHKRSGERLEITARQERNNTWSWFGSSYATIDLSVRMPAALAAEINSSSGDAKVNAIAALVFSASSGDLRVDMIAGMLTAEVSSGDVEGGDLGSVLVRRTSSGDFKLHDVRGDVKVERSGSGDLQFDKVGGSVLIGRVGSGDVSASQVAGDVTIESIGSGDVSVDGVGGSFSVRAKGSGDMHQRDVRGTVAVPHERDD